MRPLAIDVAVDVVARLLRVHEHRGHDESLVIALQMVLASEHHMGQSTHMLLGHVSADAARWHEVLRCVSAGPHGEFVLFPGDRFTSKQNEAARKALTQLIDKARANR